MVAQLDKAPVRAEAHASSVQTHGVKQRFSPMSRVIVCMSLDEAVSHGASLLAVMMCCVAAGIIAFNHTALAHADAGTSMRVNKGCKLLALRSMQRWSCLLLIRYKCKNEARGLSILLYIRQEGPRSRRRPLRRGVKRIENILIEDSDLLTETARRLALNNQRDQSTTRPTVKEAMLPVHETSPQWSIAVRLHGWESALPRGSASEQTPSQPVGPLRRALLLRKSPTGSSRAMKLRCNRTHYAVSMVPCCVVPQQAC